MTSQFKTLSIVMMLWLLSPGVHAGAQEPAAQGQAAEPATTPPLTIEPAKEIDSQAWQCCEEKKPEAKPKPSPYKILFYENDFSYLDDPNYVSTDFFDRLKRITFGCNDKFKLDIGGELRWRGVSEDNRRLNGIDDGFQLYRTRLYLDAHYGKRLRAYVEGIDAVSFEENQVPLVIDENRADLQNYFGELLLLETESGKLSGRYGRQELLYGDQRLVSPLDWANTRRTFDNVAKLLYRSKEFDLDVFWGRPIVPDVHNFDQGDFSRQFGGAYGVIKSIEKLTIDLYFLTLLEKDDLFVGSDLLPGDGEVYTLGTRWKADLSTWLFEIETAYQFGNQANLERSAGMFTGGIARRFADAPWKPELWLYYDWASGDPDPTDGQFNTFNQLFPLGHKYFGILDLVARENVRDPNVLLLLKPTKKLNLSIWYHHFLLDEARDALFNAAGAPTRFDPTGAAGRNIGDEIDLIATYNLNKHTVLELGYAHLFPGEFLKQTGFGGSASFVYGMVNYRF